MARALLLVLATLALLAGCAAPTKSEGGPSPQRFEEQGGHTVVIDTEGKDLAEFMAEIGARVGRRIVVEADIQETIDVSFREIPWREAVDVLAKMFGCEVEERGDVLYVYRPACRLFLQFSRADLRTVLQLVAAYAGLDLVLGAEVKGEITLDLRRGSPLTWLESLVRAAGLHAAEFEGVVTVRAKPLEGELELEFASPEPQRGPAPRNRLLARGVGLDTWLLVLANYAQRDLIVVRRSSCSVDADLRDTHWLAAGLRACVAARAGFACEGALWRVQEDSTGKPSKRAPLPLRLEFERGVRDAHVEALVEVPPEERPGSCVVIDGRIYFAGDPLLNADGDELPAFVTEIRADRLGLRIEGRDLSVPLNWR